MNLAIRGIDANLGDRSDDSFHRDLHPDLRADFILANPPFNKDDWYSDALAEDPRWNFGRPPRGNANFAWISHIAHHLAPGGIAGFVMPNISLSSKSAEDARIRRGLLEAGLVDCIVALPSKMFLNTGSAVCLWIMRRPAGDGPRRDEVLFIDAQGLGRLEGPTLRVFDDHDIRSVSETYWSWLDKENYSDRPGFSWSATTEDIVERAWSLATDLYVVPDPADGAATSKPGADVETLAARVRAHLLESDKLASALEQQIAEFLSVLAIGKSRTPDTDETTLNDLTTMISRGVTPRYSDDEEELLVLNQKCIRDGRTNVALARRTLAEKVPEHKYLAPNDVLVNSTGVGTLGRVARWVRESKATVDSHVTIVRFDPGKLDPVLGGFLLLALQPAIARMGEGSTGQTELARAKLGALRVRVPAPSVATELLPLLKGLETLGETSARGLSLATSLRDQLVSRLGAARDTNGRA
jgi:N-6 DNA Methylase